MASRLPLILVVAFVAAACGASTSSAPVAPAVPAGGTGEGATSPVPGNSILLTLPSDAPKSVPGAVAEPSCGGIVSFEVDPDISPAPTLPRDVTEAASVEKAEACLMSAWNGHRAAALETAETTDEQDAIFTIYRLPGDGTVDLIVRLDSWTEKTVTWTETTCRGLTLQDGRVTPMDCDTEHRIG